MSATARPLISGVVGTFGLESKINTQRPSPPPSVSPFGLEIGQSEAIQPQCRAGDAAATQDLLLYEALSQPSKPPKTLWKEKEALNPLPVQAPVAIQLYTQCTGPDRAAR